MNLFCLIIEDILEEVKQAMKNAVDTAKAGSCPRNIRGLGKFKRNEGGIYWVRVEKEDTIWRIQKESFRFIMEVTKISLMK